MGNCFASTSKPPVREERQEGNEHEDNDDDREAVTFSYNPPPTAFPTTPINATDWDIKPFVKMERHAWHPPLHIDGEKLAEVRRGFLPGGMDDRWFIWSFPPLELEGGEGNVEGKKSGGTSGKGGEMGMGGIGEGRKGTRKKVRRMKGQLVGGRTSMQAGKPPQEEVVVHFHRSWTGHEILAITIELDPPASPNFSQSEKAEEEGEKEGRGEPNQTKDKRKKERGGTIVEVKWESDSERGGVVAGGGVEEAKRMVIGICEGILEVQLTYPQH
ncbi:hypothetical protein B0J14DRAFT_564444 [Halenospora varia]|nr:hypothetical protein B0J14DRAFT_564444 [Halenospora varia]